MNRIVFTAQQIVQADDEHQMRVVLNARQHEHLRSVHRAVLGDELRVGLLNGHLGRGTVISLDDKRAELVVTLTDAPPPKSGTTLLLALPRPKMLKRILQMVCTLGVDELVLLNSFRVEKSFWQSPFLTAEAIEEQLLLGLEQAGDTVPPKVTLAKRFKPFVEDELPALLMGKQAFVAHPHEQAVDCPTNVDGPKLLVIGPEGGFIPYEFEHLQAAGLKPISLGSRILRVETAVAVGLGRLISPASR